MVIELHIYMVSKLHCCRCSFWHIYFYQVICLEKNNSIRLSMFISTISLMIWKIKFQINIINIQICIFLVCFHIWYGHANRFLQYTSMKKNEYLIWLITHQTPWMIKHNVTPSQNHKSKNLEWFICFFLVD